MCEDVLVRANEYCRQSGMRFGQLLVNAVRERLAQHNVLVAGGVPGNTPTSDSTVFNSLFYIENEALEEAIMAFVTKHTARHEALIRTAQYAANAGQLFDLPNALEVDHVQPGE
jgi:hypothetical protein